VAFGILENVIKAVVKIKRNLSAVLLGSIGTFLIFKLATDFPTRNLPFMPRQSRIDAPGAVHHIIARGIARKRVFYDDKDRNAFLD
jgi:hypothetical protein